MSTFLCKNGVRKEYFLTPTFIIEPKKADKYKSILLSSLVRSVIIYEDFIEIQYNYKKKLPILQNPVKIKSSYLNNVVIHPGFEPGTP